MKIDADLSNMKYVSKGWGYELWIDNNEKYCGKKLFVHKGKQLSVHYHKLKTETFFVAEGEARIITYTNPELDSLIAARSFNWLDTQIAYGWIDAKSYFLQAGDRLQIPVGTRHTIKALLDATIFEFSTQHFDEDSFRVLKGD